MKFEDSLNGNLVSKFSFLFLICFFLNLPSERFLSKQKFSFYIHLQFPLLNSSKLQFNYIRFIFISSISRLKMKKNYDVKTLFAIIGGKALSIVEIDRSLTTTFHRRLS